MSLSDYSLVSFDVDGTIFRKPVLLEAAHNLGVAARWDALDELYDLGQIGRREALESLYKLLVGIRVSDILHEVAKVEVMKNVSETVKRLCEFRVKMILLTDIPDFICYYVMEKFGFEGFVSSRVGQKGGTLIGNIEPLDDKLLGLRNYLSSLSIPLLKCIHIGDGTNDVPVFREVGHSIAVNSKSEKVRMSASTFIETDDMLDVYGHLSTLR